MKKIFSLLIIAIFAVQLFAQGNLADIFKSLAAVDTTSGAKVKVHQDKRIEDSMADRKGGQVVHAGSGPGFRIQVFSSNEQRTAKSEAFAIEKELREYFPTLGIYVSYSSPFWKVRVGDFKSTAEAHELMNEITTAFPKLKNVTYTVKDKINF